MRRRKQLRARTPLQRTKALRQVAPLARGAPLARRTPLKRTGTWRASKATWERLDAQAHAAWKQKVTHGRCVVCVADGRERDAHPEHDPHHVLPQRVIRRYVRSLRLPVEDAKRLLRSLLWDPRNGICLDRRCHDKHESGFRPVPRELIPAKAFQFARELGLDWWLEKHYP